MASTVDAEDVRGGGYPQFFEKDVRHSVIEMLASVYHDLVELAGSSNGPTDRGSLDELWPRPDNA